MADRLTALIVGASRGLGLALAEEWLKRDARVIATVRSDSKELKTLQERRAKLERLLAVHYPSLRTSDSLFPEWATFDFSAIDHASYRQTIQKIACIHRQLFDNTKFDLMTRYKLGNIHYLVTTSGLLHEHEAPLGWGLLELDEKGVLIEKCIPTRFPGIEMQQWLERIARAATLQNIRPIDRKSDQRFA